MAHISIRAQKFLIIFGSTYGKNNRQRSIDIRRTKGHLIVAKEKQFPSIYTLLVSMLSHDPKLCPTAAEVTTGIESLLSAYTVYIVSLGPSFKSEDSMGVRLEAVDR
jgi:hypothetical protein